MEFRNFINQKGYDRKIVQLEYSMGDSEDEGIITCSCGNNVEGVDRLYRCINCKEEFVGPILER